MTLSYSAPDDRGFSNPTQEQDLAVNPEIRPSTEAILGMATLTAHLLIGDLTEAENAVMEAIDSWDPSRDDGEQLFQITLRAAVARRPIALFSTDSTENGATEWKLPIELHRVLKLPPDLRQSFVLRVLVGLSLQVCAQILEVGAREISEHCCAAMTRLSAFDG